MARNTTTTITCDCCGHTFPEGVEPYDTLMAHQSAPSYFCYAKGCNLHQRAALVERMTGEAAAHAADIVPEVTAPTSLATTVLAEGGTFVADTYGWKVTATTLAGETVASAEVTEAVTAGGSVDLTWDEVTGATGYRIYRTDNPGTYPPSSLVGTSLATTFTDTGQPVTVGAAPSTNTSGGIPVVTVPYL